MLPRGKRFTQGVKVSARLLCTTKGSDESPPKEKKSHFAKPLSLYEQWRPHSMKIGMGAAASLTLYGLSSFMWDMTYNIMTMSPASGKAATIATSHDYPSQVILNHLFDIHKRCMCVCFVIQQGCTMDSSLASG
jgi:hypothetical protein